MPKAVTPPICPPCGLVARLTDGVEIYPHRRDLHAKPMWKCEGCGGYVGCHDGTTKPLGTPAGPELRKARRILHEQMIDPLWMEADRSGLYRPEDAKARAIIRGAARNRVYAYLAFHLGRAKADTHTGVFDLETCRQAWRVLNGVSYSQIRDWAKDQKVAA